MTFRRTFYTVAAAAMLLTSAHAAMASEDDITYRKSVMKAVGGNFKAIALIAKGQAGDMKNLTMHTDSLAGLAKAAATAFPEKSGPMDGKTAVKMDVWEKPEDFKKVLMAFAEETEKLAAAAKAGDKDAIGAQIAAVGKNACKACHDTYKEKD